MNNAMAGAGSRRLNSKKFFSEGCMEGTLAESALRYFPEIEFRPVRTVEEFEDAMRLVQAQYELNGFSQPNRSRKRLTLFQLLPTTVVIVARHRVHGIMATLSVVEDSALGLQLESIYKQEVEGLRNEGRHLGEFSLFAADKQKCEQLGLGPANAERFILICHVIRAAYDYVRLHTRIDTMIECSHPDHDGFYNLIQMERLGGLKAYKAVNGSPAMARFLDINKALKEGIKNASFRLFFGELPVQDLSQRIFQFECADIRRMFIAESDVFTVAAHRQKRCVLSHYPESYGEYLYDESEMKRQTSGWAHPGQAMAVQSA